jgi:hypothetical protein
VRARWPRNLPGPACPRDAATAVCAICGAAQGSECTIAALRQLFGEVDWAIGRENCSAGLAMRAWAFGNRSFVHGLETLPFISTHVYDTERRVQGQHINGRAGPRLPCYRYAGPLTHTVGVALWPARAARVAWICDRTKAKFGNHGRVGHEGASGASCRASRVFDQICSKIRPAIFQADHATGTGCLCCDGCESTERRLLFEKPQSGEGYTAIHVQGTPLSFRGTRGTEAREPE